MLLAEVSSSYSNASSNWELFQIVLVLVLGYGAFYLMAMATHYMAENNKVRARERWERDQYR